jgi:S-layer protein (TIGR01567 family)
MNETTKKSLLMFLILTSISFAQGVEEIRGPTAEVLDGAVYEWDANDFVGFYYDADDDLGTEQITLDITENYLEDNSGAVYQTTAQEDDLEFEDWGPYYSMAFLGEEYFAGYVEGDEYEYSNYLATESLDHTLLAQGQLTRILKNDDKKRIITTSKPLVLEDGYELRLGGVDPKTRKTYIELHKDGSFVDLKVLEPLKDGATLADKTYIYKTDLGDTKDIVIIAAHFKNVFHAADDDLATVDGVWQISDRPVRVDEGSKFGKMTVQDLRSGEGEMYLKMSNEGERIILNGNRGLHLMGNFKIRTADQDFWGDEEPLRFYIYRELAAMDANETKEGIESVTEVATFETSDELDVIQVTEPQTDDFAFNAWGKYSIVLFQGDKYFAGYLESDDYSFDDSYLLEKSVDDYPFEDEQISKVLMDDNQERTISTDSPLELKGGYQLALKGVDDHGWLWVTLRKDGEIVDQELLIPSSEYACMADETYTYNGDLGYSKDIVTIAVHFSAKTFKGSDKGLSDMAVVDGVWQISDTPVKVRKVPSSD